jgi:hypothetical protein
MTRGLPPPIQPNTSGTNVYGTPVNSDLKQVQMLKMLTGGKNKKGGNGKIIVPQDPHGGQANGILKNLMQISGQANANAKFDALKGGGRRRTKKTKRSRKRSKKTRNPPFRKRWSQKLK